MHSLLAKSDPDVLAYAAQLGDENVVREFLNGFPNEVCDMKEVKCERHLHSNG